MLARTDDGAGRPNLGTPTRRVLDGLGRMFFVEIIGTGARGHQIFFGEVGQATWWGEEFHVVMLETEIIAAGTRVIGVGNVISGIL